MQAIPSAVLALAILAGGPAFAHEPAADAEKALKALNDAYEAGNVEVIRQLVTADHLSVTPYAGTMAVAEQLKTLPDLKLTAYDAGKMTARPLGADAILFTYTLTQKGTFAGKPVPPRCAVSSVWVRKDGKWREAYYQETAVAEK